MSTAISQKLSPGIHPLHRLGVAYFITDEIFAVEVRQKGDLNPFYTYGAGAVAAPLWAAGTALGILVGNLMLTVAAAMVLLSRWRGRDDFCDPFCGSGTIPIEAALIALGRAPGLNRGFSAMRWDVVDPRLWDEAKEEARSREYHGSYRIVGSDIDPKALALAKENAERAGVADVVRFELADATKFDRPTERGVIVTNPPYGERIGGKDEAEELYRAFGEAWRRNPNWQLYLLSSHTEFERCFGRQADKKRKLYNGMIKCDLFMYYKDRKA
jgi:putative N6-adenine-specific DNA methylase